MNVLISRIRVRRASRPLAAALCGAALAGACAGNFAMAPREPDSDGLAWLSPTGRRDLRLLERWRRSVGPVFLASASPSPLRATRQLLVVSWNTAVGSGDVLAFLEDLRASRGADVPVVLLLQEVYRSGASVPHDLGRGASFAGRLGLSADPARRRDDIAAIAAASGLHAYYAPSMRNGSPAVSDEDRGNAILSSLALSDLTAIELPFERQRRVAIAATLQGTSGSGVPWKLRVVSAHLDNVAGLRRLSIAGSWYARTRQARALVAFLADSAPTVLAGDFNTWFGFSDPAYRETARAFRAAKPRDRRATFRGLLRLDHLFFRLPDGWRAEYERGNADFGSDHYPLIATIDLQ